MAGGWRPLVLCVWPRVRGQYGFKVWALLGPMGGGVCDHLVFSPTVWLRCFWDGGASMESRAAVLLATWRRGWHGMEIWESILTINYTITAANTLITCTRMHPCNLVELENVFFLSDTR